jgi:hypothetical protein
MAKTCWVPTDRYIAQPHRGALVDSCIALLNAMLAAYGVVPSQRRYWLSRVMWTLTECEGKYNVPWASTDAIRCTSTREVTHEHVFPRGWLLDKILAEPHNLQLLAPLSVACIVTKREAARLNHQPPALGWGRYLNEGITVHDMLTFDRVPVPELMRRMPVP